MSKGILLDDCCTILRTGTACNGPIPWESPYVDIEYEGKEYTWHADSVGEHVLDIPDNTYAYIRAFAYGDRLRRVQLAIPTDIPAGQPRRKADYSCYGMAKKPWW